MSNFNKKACIHCGMIKDITEFPKDASYKDGYRSSCKNCRNFKRRTGTYPEDIYLDKLPEANASSVTIFDSCVLPVEILPEPEKLPAAYLKRCAEYWLDLIGSDTTHKMRIA